MSFRSLARLPLSRPARVLLAGVRTPFLPTAYRAQPWTLQRCYASTAESAVEAPDYLDEQERKIFDTLKSELQPTKLEVSS
jgi:hypothetical protein